MPLATQLIISLENKPGALSRVASALGSAGVNIKAFLAPETSGGGRASTGKLRIIVTELDRARVALKAHRLRFREESALVLSLENKPGALQDVAELLKAARINITCGYCTPSREGKRAIVVLTVSNHKKALEALRGKSLDEF
jgi:hypothetical protein